MCNPSTKLTDAERDRIAALRASGLSLAEVVRRSGWSRMSVCRALKVAGLVWDSGKARQEIVRLTKCGRTVPQIAERLRIDKGSVYQHLLAAGVRPARPKPNAGDPTADMTAAELDALVESRRATMPVEATDHSPYSGPRFGRCADVVRTKAARVWRKGKR